MLAERRVSSARGHRISKPLKSRCGSLRRATITMTRAQSGEGEQQGNTKSAVVLGAGPCGLASAIGLSQRGFSVDVVERRDDPVDERPRWAFGLALDDARAGRAFEHLGVSHLVNKWGLRAPRDLGRRVDPDGTVSEALVPNKKDTQLRSNYLIYFPRSRLVGMLLQAVREHHSGSISLHLGTEAEMEPTERGPKIVINGETKNPQLVVAGDGARSKTRDMAMQSLPGAGKKFDFTVDGYWSWTQFSPFKALRIDTTKGLVKPEYDKDSNVEIDRGSLVGFFSNITDPERSFRLVVLPDVEDGVRRAVGDGTGTHLFCKTESVDEAYRILEDNFPPLNLDSIPREEMERFVQAEPGQKPQPSLARSLAATFDDCSVVLVGDSAHSLPPDLGQGANSGLEDVMMLLKELDDKMGDVFGALQSYEDKRMADLQALMELHLYAMPPPGASKLTRYTWLASVVMRRVFNDWVPQLFDPPAVTLVSRGLTYKEALKRHHATSAKIAAFVSVVSLASLAAVGSFVFRS